MHAPTWHKGEAMRPWGLHQPCQGGSGVVTWCSMTKPFMEEFAWGMAQRWGNVATRGTPTKPSIEEVVSCMALKWRKWSNAAIGGAPNKNKPRAKEFASSCMAWMWKVMRPQGVYQAVFKKERVCVTHDARAKCGSHRGCTNGAVKWGLYITHGAKVKQCSLHRMYQGSLQNMSL